MVKKTIIIGVRTIFSLRSKTKKLEDSFGYFKQFKTQCCKQV